MVLMRPEQHVQIVAGNGRPHTDFLLYLSPCGGYDDIGSERTEFPLAGGPIQLKMGHDHSDVQVNIAMGNDVSGDDYTITLLLISEMGLGEFCLGNVVRRTRPKCLSFAEYHLFMIDFR